MPEDPGLAQELLRIILHRDELVRAVGEAHLFGRKFYLTVNTLLKDNEIDELYDYLAPLYEAGLDAVIVPDAGVIEYIRDVFPRLDIHASTQMTVTGSYGAKFLEETGCHTCCPGARAVSRRDTADPGGDGTGDRMLCPRSVMLLLFRTVPAKQHDRRQERQQGTVRSAVPAALYRERKKEVLSESEGYLYSGDHTGLVDAGIDSFKIEGRMKKPE